MQVNNYASQQLCKSTIMQVNNYASQQLRIAQSFSPNLAQDGQPAANFSVTKMQEENSIIQ
jgi:hypothetical protein